MPRETDLSWFPKLIELIPLRISVNQALREIGISKARLHKVMKSHWDLKLEYAKAIEIQQNKLAAIRKRIAQKNVNEMNEMFLDKEKEELEQFTIAINQTNGNISEAAKLMSMSRATVYRRVQSNPEWRRVKNRTLLEAKDD